MTSYSSSDTPGVYANILLDRWFKRSFKEFGDAKRLMLLFLQALIPERKITSITYASEESTNQNPDGKSIRVDVECTDADGQRFVVEIQQSEQHYFYDRAVFNSTFAIQRQLKKGGDSYRFLPVYFIGIMRFSLNKESGQFLYRYSLMEDSTGQKMTDDLLFTSANLSNFTPEDKIKYQNDMTTERDIRNQIAFARDKGLEEGEAKGKADIARAMLAKGFDASTILELTGLTAEQLSAMK